MINAKLKEQFTKIISWHYEKELWHSRPEEAYEESIEPFVDDLVRAADCYKNGRNFGFHQNDETETNATTVLGEKIGQKIKELRLKNGLSLAQLAEKAEISTEYLLSIEYGEPILRIWALEQILNVLQVRSSAILPF